MTYIEIFHRKRQKDFLFSPSFVSNVSPPLCLLSFLILPLSPTVSFSLSLHSSHLSSTFPFIVSSPLPFSLSVAQFLTRLQLYFSSSNSSRKPASGVIILYHHFSLAAKKASTEATDSETSVSFFSFSQLQFPNHSITTGKPQIMFRTENDMYTQFL